MHRIKDDLLTGLVEARSFMAEISFLEIEFVSERGPGV
jgi:hypothetical protein